MNNIGVVIGGGGNAPNPNVAGNSVWHAVIAGGLGNFIGNGAQAAVVSGGASNHVMANHGVVAGGQDNEAAGRWSSVSGGENNHATRDYAVVAGGLDNAATGTASFVAGGVLNTAEGELSLAGGFNAHALHDGAIVFAAGYNNGPFPSASSSEFAVRAPGGVRILSSLGGAGAILTPGNGSWSSLSDRAAKRDLAPVDGEVVLSAVARMPIFRWSYTTQADGIRHMGPTSQDFRAAFGLGESEKTIDVIDADGVNLAAVQALEKRTAKLQESAAKLQDENAALRDELARMGAAQRLMLQRLDEMAKRQRH